MPKSSSMSEDGREQAGAALEEKIRARIEAILTGEARSDAEIRRVSGDDTSPGSDSIPGENIYRQTINSYRGALREVNGLLEEIVGFLSALYQVVEAVNENNCFQEICAKIVDCVLRHFGAEYCSLSFCGD